MSAHVGNGVRLGRHTWRPLDPSSVQIVIAEPEDVS